MARFEKNAVVDHPIEKVFGFLSEQNQAQWHSQVQEAKVTSGGSLRTRQDEI